MRQVVVTGGLAILAFVVMVPVLASVIRQIEPGRDRTIEIQNLANEKIDIPETGPFVQAHCADPCRIGSWMKLYVGRIDKPGVLAVWAESEADRVWYYPSDASFFPEVPPSEGTHVLSDGMKLGRGHAGHKRWKLKLAVLDKRYTRDEILQLAPEHMIAHEELMLELGEGKR